MCCKVALGPEPTLCLSSKGSASERTRWRTLSERMQSEAARASASWHIHSPGRCAEARLSLLGPPSWATLRLSYRQGRGSET